MNADGPAAAFTSRVAVEFDQLDYLRQRANETNLIQMRLHLIYSFFTTRVAVELVQ